MFGTAYFGQIYFAGVVVEPPPGGSRDNCGGMFGTATYGQPYFGQHIQCEPPPVTHDNCGGMFGTATFGQPYFGQHIQCGSPIPPPPPPPPPPFIIGGGGAGYFPLGRSKKKLAQILKEKIPLRDLSKVVNPDVPAVDSDDDEIALIVSSWLNLK